MSLSPKQQWILKRINELLNENQIPGVKVEYRGNELHVSSALAFATAVGNIVRHVESKADKMSFDGVPALMSNAVRQKLAKMSEVIQAPRVLVTVTQLPSGALEVQTNHEDLDYKIMYILDNYDENMRLKHNLSIQIKDIILL